MKASPEIIEDVAKALFDFSTRSKVKNGWDNVPETQRVTWRRKAKEALEPLPEYPEEIARYRAALERISQPLDCGCTPCTGACRDKDGMETEVNERRELAAIYYAENGDA